MRSRVTRLLAMAFACSAHGQQMEPAAQYTMFCASCHGPDGKGTGGQFPPLAGSDWIKGDPERMVQVILHGMEGPVTVSGKEFNLAMPPQGAALTDEQIAAIVSHVRSSWGNSESAIQPGEVAEMRKHSAKRQTPWSAEAVLKRWPLPEAPGPLKNLLSYTYKGAFEALPDFSKLKPVAVEEEHAGRISVTQSGMQDLFAMVWEGELEVPRDGEYQFVLDSDDGSRVIVNGQKVAEILNNGPLGRAVDGSIALKKGTAKVRIEYYEAQGGQGISLTWRGPGLSEQYLSEKLATQGPTQPSIPIEVEGEARIYRNFIAGTSPRGIAVGYPGGVNLSFSADELGIGVAWVGDFMDAGRHWTDRGQGFQKPSGRRIITLGGQPAFATFEGGAWPDKWQDSLPHRFGGYSLDDLQRPEFHYQVGGVKVEDKPQNISGSELVRSLVFHVDGNAPANLAMRLAGGGAKAVGSHHYDLGQGVHLEIAQSEVAEPVLGDQGLVLKLKLPAGESRVGLRYLWK